MNKKAIAALTDYSGQFWTDAPALLVLVVEFAAQNPGLDFQDYGDRTAYRSDARRITNAWHDVAKAVQSCRIHGVTDGDLIQAAEGAFSGRLSLVVRSDKPELFRVDYCTGQYWPTEYRYAAAAVLEYAARIAYNRKPDRI